MEGCAVGSKPKARHVLRWRGTGRNGARRPGGEPQVGKHTGWTEFSNMSSTAQRATGAVVWHDEAVAIWKPITTCPEHATQEKPEIALTTANDALTRGPIHSIRME